MNLTEFADAILRGDSQSILDAIDRDPDLLRALVRGTTPLLLSIYCGHHALAAALIERGAPVTFAEACAAGKVDEVRTMLERDASLVEEFSIDGFPPLGLAIFFGRDDIARLLLDHGADVSAHAQNSQGVAPIHAAVARGNEALVHELLDRGVDPNDPQENGVTPLHGAAAAGNGPLAMLLIARGADGRKRTSDGRTPSDLARDQGHVDLAAAIDGA